MYVYVDPLGIRAKRKQILIRKEETNSWRTPCCFLAIQPPQSPYVNAALSEAIGQLLASYNDMGIYPAFVYIIQ